MKLPKEVSRQREQEVWDLRIKCWTQERIAAKLQISQPAVAKILKRLTERYSRNLNDDIERVKLEQISQLEHIASEAMQAWDDSKQEIAVSKDFTRYFPGDPRYLTAAMEAKEDIRKIIGADAPIKTINELDLSKLTDEQLQAIAKGQSAS